MNKKWTTEEKNILKKYYKRKSKKGLMDLLPNRSWAAINQYSQKLNIKRSYDTVRTTDVKKLMLETPEAYYWMGFLIADGHFTEKRIIVGLSIKDVKHLRKFAKFISANCSEGRSKRYGNCYVRASNSDVIPLLRKKFNICNNKTYNPCDITKIKDEGLLLSLIIGFIDGDGSITKQVNRADAFLRIKCHSSWLFNLQFISDTICKHCDLKPNIAKINNQGYAMITFSNSIILKFLKAKGKELNLPTLKRKWDKINDNYISKMETYPILVNRIKELVQEGLRNCEIAQILDKNDSHISIIVSKNKLR